MPARGLGHHRPGGEGPLGRAGRRERLPGDLVARASRDGHVPGALGGPGAARPRRRGPLHVHRRGHAGRDETVALGARVEPLDQRGAGGGRRPGGTGRTDRPAPAVRAVRAATPATGGGEHGQDEMGGAHAGRVITVRHARTHRSRVARRACGGGRAGVEVRHGQDDPDSRDRWTTGAAARRRAGGRARAGPGPRPQHRGGRELRRHLPPHRALPAPAAARARVGGGGPGGGGRAGGDAGRPGRSRRLPLEPGPRRVCGGAAHAGRSAGEASRRHPRRRGRGAPS